MWCSTSAVMGAGNFLCKFTQPQVICPPSHGEGQKDDETPESSGEARETSRNGQNTFVIEMTFHF